MLFSVVLKPPPLLLLTVENCLNQSKKRTGQFSVALTNFRNRAFVKRILTPIERNDVPVKRILATVIKILDPATIIFASAKRNGASKKKNSTNKKVKTSSHQKNPRRDKMEKGKMITDQPNSKASPSGTLAKSRTTLHTNPSFAKSAAPRAPILDRVVRVNRKILQGCPAREYTIYRVPGGQDFLSGASLTTTQKLTWDRRQKRAHGANTMFMQLWGAV